MSDATNRAGKMYKRIIFVAGVVSDAVLRKQFGLKWQFTSADVNRLYTNTLRLMQRSGFKPIVKRGHDDMDEAQKGYIDKLELMQHNGKPALEATFWLNEPWASEMDRGLFPSVSIEATDDRVDSIGEPAGPVVEGFALLGNRPPALGHLPYVYDRQGTTRIYFTMLKDVSEMGLFTKTAKSKAEKEQTKAAKVKTVAAKAEEEEEDEEEAKYDAMADIEAIKEGLGVVAEGQEAATTMRKALGVDAPAELDAIDLAFEQLEECLRTLMESIESGAGEETAAEPDEEDDEEYRKRGATSQYRRQVATLRVLQTAQRKALAKLQAERHAEKRAAEKAQYDNSFAGLHGRGAVVAEDRDAFDLMAKAKGVDYAANFFDAKARRDNPYQNFRIPEKDVKAQYSEQEFAQRYALVKKMSPHLSEKKEADKAQLEEITKRALATHAGQK